MVICVVVIIVLVVVFSTTASLVTAAIEYISDKSSDSIVGSSITISTVLFAAILLVVLGMWSISIIDNYCKCLAS